MKILQIGKFHPVKGGIELTMLEISKGLQSKGIQNDLLMAGLSADSQTVTHGKSKIFTPKTWFEYASTCICPGFVSKLAKIGGNYDLIHIHHPDPMACLALFVVRPSCKIVLHWHCDVLKQKFFYFFYRFFEAWLLRRSSVVVCTSENYASFSRPLRKFREKIQIVPIGIPPDYRKSKPDLVHSLRQKYGGCKIVLSVGRLTHYKGYEYLIRAAKALSEDHKILIAGEGKMRMELEREIEESGTTGKVELLGKVPDENLGAYYEICDIFCFPSINRVEAFGIAMLEAMQKGKPVLSTELEGSGVPWVNQNGVSGLNVPIKDARALTEAILKITQNESLHRRFGEGALKRAEELTATGMADKIAQIYESLLSK